MPENWPHVFTVSLFETAALDVIEHLAVSEISVGFLS
jgi:hypothetical protein